MGKYEVTQKQWFKVMGTTIEDQQAKAGVFDSGISGKGNSYPMYYVSWYDAIVFCNKLSMINGLNPVYRISNSTDPANWPEIPDYPNTDVTLDSVEMISTANGYRLPTEAEWEYACRAGAAMPVNTGDTLTTDQANFIGNYPSDYYPKRLLFKLVYRLQTIKVGSFAPNAWKLYDMHGNVAEWCWDWYGAYSSDTQTDPLGASFGSNRVERGGSWGNNSSYIRSAYRGYSNSSLRYTHVGFRVVRN